MTDFIDKLIAHPATQLITWLQFAVAITIFTYYTTTPIFIPAGNTDMVLHFLGNFLLFLSARTAFLMIKSHWFVVAFALIYGSLMETAQYFLPSRYFDALDLLANWLGVLAGFILAVLIEFGYKKLRERTAVKKTK